MKINVKFLLYGSILLVTSIALAGVLYTYDLGYAFSAFTIAMVLALHKKDKCLKWLSRHKPEPELAVVQPQQPI